MTEQPPYWILVVQTMYVQIVYSKLRFYGYDGFYLWKHRNRSNLEPLMINTYVNYDVSVNCTVS